MAQINLFVLVKFYYFSLFLILFLCSCLILFFQRGEIMEVIWFFLMKFCWCDFMEFASQTFFQVNFKWQ